MIDNDFFSEYLTPHQTYLRSQVFFGNPIDYDEEISEMMSYAFGENVRRFNNEYCSRKRKTIQSICEEAAKRGYDAPEVTDDSATIRIKGHSFIYFKEGSFRRIQWLTGMQGAYSRVTLDADKLLDCLEFFIDSVLPAVKPALEDCVSQLRKEMTINAMLLPSLCIQAEKELNRRGIKYFIKSTSKGLTIYANIAKDMWFHGPLNEKNFDRVIPMIPYGVKRPDCISDIGPGFRAEFRNYEYQWLEYRRKLTDDNT